MAPRCWTLCYTEDSTAEVDMNIVQTGSGGFVEVQGTAEGQPFSRKLMDELTALGEQGIKQLVAMQKGELGDITAAWNL